MNRRLQGNQLTGRGVGRFVLTREAAPLLELVRNPFQKEYRLAETETASSWFRRPFRNA